MNKLFTLSIALISTYLTSNAQTGSLDLSFDTDGKVTTDIESKADVARAVAIQADGKIVVAGYSENATNRDFSVVRYNTDGSLDNTFDTDGKVTTAIGPNTDEAYALAIQGDGKILVAGFTYGTNWDFAITRYNTDGTLDNTFDTDGILIITGGSNALTGIKSIALQGDGKIVVAGNDGTNYVVMRINSNGSLDTTFDTDGKTIANFGTGTHYTNSIAIQSDGKIVVGGTFNNTNFAEFAIARFNTDGSLDNTFDSDGKVTTSTSSIDEHCYSIALQSDGKIVAVGYLSTNSSNRDFAVVRYNTNGSLDTNFDTDGIFSTNVGGTKDYAYSVAIQSDSKIVLAGYANRTTGSYEDFALVRLNSDGTMDNTFSGDGIVTTAFFTKAQINAITIQTDGKIVAAGYTENFYYEYAVARYNSLTIGIQENFLYNSISVFPNPSSGKFTISTVEEISEIDVYDLTGKLLLNTKNKTEINLSNLSCGVYYAKFKINGKVVTKKIVKE